MGILPTKDAGYYAPIQALATEELPLGKASLGIIPDFDASLEKYYHHGRYA